MRTSRAMSCKRSYGNHNFGLKAVRARRLVLFTAMVLCGIVTAGALHGVPAGLQTNSPPRPGFVGTQGTHFFLDGKPLFVAGVNNHYLTFGSKAEVERVLDDAAAMHSTVVRTFIQPVIGSLDGVTQPTIWDWRRQAQSSDLGVHGNYLIYWDPSRNGMAFNEGPSGMQKLDFLVKEAAERKLKLILSFLDFWDYTGGAQQMRAWYKSSDKNTFFFKDERTKSDFRKLIRSVLLRKNSLTGLIYKEDPAIFAWELMNEPNIERKSLLYDWVSEMSSFVKSIDPNHLVSSGHANVENRLSDITIPTIDFTTWHGYPKYYNQTPAQMTALIKDFCDIAARAQKPVLLEEFGYARSNPDQIEAYRSWLAALNQRPDCAGWLVWRLVSLQDNLRYPKDEYDQFDVHNDGGALWSLLSEGARWMSRKGEVTERR